MGQPICIGARRASAGKPLISPPVALRCSWLARIDLPFFLLPWGFSAVRFTGGRREIPDFPGLMVFASVELPRHTFILGYWQASHSVMLLSFSSLFYYAPETHARTTHAAKTRKRGSSSFCVLLSELRHEHTDRRKITRTCGRRQTSDPPPSFTTLSHAPLLCWMLE